MENLGGQLLENGTPIRGLLSGEVEYLRTHSSSKKDLYKNTINLWLWKDKDNIDELLAVLSENKIDRINSNPSGSNKSKTMGAGVSIPLGLYQFLTKVDPELFEDKKRLQYFKREFPQFKTYSGV